MKKGPSHNDIDQALLRVTNSKTLQNSDRSKEFLRYVVAESLANRGSAICGKTIAADVFGRDPAETDSDNVVRVEARRLRRKLEDYYRQEGENDPLRIHIDAGGYAPRFELVKTIAPSSVKGSRTKLDSLKALLLALIAVTLVAFGFLFYRMAVSPQVTDKASQQKINERKAFREKSLATLQAVNLDLQGRNLFFPLFDPDRQNLALSLFQRAMEIDPTYFGSYASAAHSMGTLALMTPPGPQRDQLLRSSSEMATRAVELAPQEGWAHAGNAWAHFATKDFDAAIHMIELAHQLAPDNGSVLDSYGLVMLVTGNFEKSVAATSPDRTFQDTGLRLGRRNIFAVSSFHLGDYQNTLDSLNVAIEQGDAVSGPTLVFTAASLEGLGQTEKAKEVLDELQRTFPNFRPHAVFSQFYQNPEDSVHVLEYLRRIEWQE